MIDDEFNNEVERLLTNHSPYYIASLAVMHIDYREQAEKRIATLEKMVGEMMYRPVNATCQYYDCGWCYAPENLTTTAMYGECRNARYCPQAIIAKEGDTC